MEGGGGAGGGVSGGDVLSNLNTKDFVPSILLNASFK